MDDTLKVMLEDGKVSEAAIAHLLSKGIFTVLDFANAIDLAAQVPNLFNGVEDLKQNTNVIARTKMCWRRAYADMEKVVKRSSEGLDAQASDEPLGAEVQRLIMGPTSKATASAKSTLVP